MYPGRRLSETSQKTCRMIVVPGFRVKKRQDGLCQMFFFLTVGYLSLCFAGSPHHGKLNDVQVVSNKVFQYLQKVPIWS